MNQLIRGLTSLSNLRKGRPAGQMATLLILATVMLLTFVLVTINIGQVAVNRTAVSNASDSAALYLASQLATKARQLYEALGNRLEKCKKTGWASFVLAIVMAIIAIVIIVVTYGGGTPAAVGFWATTTGMMVAGAAAGAVGGAIGGAIAGTGVAQGAISGAAIGAAIGGIGAGLTGALSASTTAAPTGASATTLEAGSTVTALGEGATLTTTVGGVGTTSTLAAGASATVSSAAGATTVLTAGSVGLSYAGAGSVIFGVLGVGSAGYNEYTAQEMIGKAMDYIMGMLNKASDSTRMRETTFFKALTQLVDDPNITQDTADCDGDGNTMEYVPAFQAWLYERAKNVAMPTDNVSAYIEGSMVPMLQMLSYWMNTFCLGASTESGYTSGWLEVAEYRWVTDLNTGAETIVDNGASTGDYTHDGPISSALRALYENGYPIASPHGGFVYVPGPNYADLLAYMSVDCDESGCGEMPPALASTYDEFDGVVAGIREGGAFMDGLLAATAEERAATWTSWLYMLYDPYLDADYDPENPSGTYYSLFTLYCDTILRWRQEVEDIKNSLPMCVMGSEGLYVNAPCRIDPEWTASFDGLARDQYVQFYAYTDWVYTLLYTAKELWRGMAETLTADEGDALSQCGGVNPVRYAWDDARGRHWVSVRTGQFLIPRIKKEKRGNWFSGETCMVLEHYDDSSQGADRMYVETSRYDQSKNLGLLGRWNPFNTVTKRATFYYTCRDDGSRPGRVGLRD